MKTKRSEFYDYYWLGYTYWGMGEDFVHEGVEYGFITEEEAQSILDGKYIEE